MTPTSEKPATPGPSPAWRRQVLVGILLAALLAVGVYVWLRPPVVGPPPVDLTGADPAAAAVVERARAAVAESPRSAPAWGNLGMALVAHAYNAEGNLCFARAA